MVTSTAQPVPPLPSRRWKLLGMGVGIGVAWAGVLLFALLFPLGMTIFSGDASLIKSFPGFIGFGLLFGLPASILPGGLGGILLIQTLKRETLNARFSVLRAALKGAITGGIAGVCASLLGLFVVVALSFWNSDGDSTTGYIFSNLTGIFQNFLNGVVLFIIPILLAASIAALMGAWAGRILARQLLKK